MVKVWKQKNTLMNYLVKNELSQEDKDTQIEKEKERIAKEKERIKREEVEIQQKIDSTLRDVFGLSQFRGEQREIIETVMKGKDCLVLMPTGGGKSLCYQLPAVCLGKVSVCLSPLIALMRDQMMAMQKLGIAVECWNSTINEKEKQRIIEDMKAGKITLLFTTPESIKGRLLTILKQLKSLKLLGLFAIDEAHCISQLGFDFRPDYAKLRVLRQQFPSSTIIALTATATPDVRTDVLNSLNLNDVAIFQSSFNRKEISYQVRYTDSLLGSKYQDIYNIVEERKDQFGIIYCLSRKDCDSMAFLLEGISGLSVSAYHAGLPTKQRKQIEQDFVDGKLSVVVATVAFGMGIDCSCIRYVIHSTISTSIEGFYQESGRAGRDSKPADSICYYSRDDQSKVEFVLKVSSKDESKLDQKIQKFQEMCKFCEHVGCRRAYLLSYFGEKPNEKNKCNKTCDYCKNPKQVQKVVQTLFSPYSYKQTIDQPPICHQTMRKVNLVDDVSDESVYESDDESVQEISQSSFQSAANLMSLFNELEEEEKKEERVVGKKSKRPKEGNLLRKIKQKYA